jgi:hypothetical protein
MTTTTSDLNVRIRRKTILQFADVLVDTSTNEYFWSEFRPPAFDPASDDTFYEVKENDRIDLLAFQFYGDDRLKWVLLVANNITLPEVELVPGLSLRVPSKRQLSQKLI